MKLVILLVASVIFISGCTGNGVGEVSDSDTGLYTPASGVGQGITVGKLAKDFSLTNINGDVVHLSDFRGEYVLFASMATWCTPCRIEADNVRRAQEKLDISLVVMQIDVDPRETKEDLIRFRNELGKEDWIMGFDDGTISSLYNIRTFDTTLVIDPEGKIIYRDNGFPIDTKTLEDLIIKGESSQLQLGSTHEHANITVVLGGKEVDFSQDKYQLRSSFVHFESGDGKEVHVHAKGVTIKFLFETLGWDVDACLKTDSGDYCNGSITVDGQESDIDHEIRDGENIEVVYG